MVKRLLHSAAVVPSFTFIALVVVTACNSEIIVPETPLPLLWQVPVTDVISQPAVDHDLVYFIDEHGKLFALDIENGSEYWSVPLSVESHSKGPVGVDDGLVFALQHGDEGKVLAFDGQNGEEIWDSSFGPIRHGDHPIARDGVVYFEAISPDTLMASLVAADAASGVTLWEFQAGSNVVTTPILGDDLVYIGVYDYDEASVKSRHVYAIDITTGRNRWKYPSDLDLSGEFGLDNKNLYIGMDGGVVQARKAATGEPAWTARVGQLSNSPSAVAGLVFVGNKDGEFIALDAGDGSQVWSLSVGSPVLTQAALYKDIIYFGTNEGYMYAVDARTGEELWKVLSPVRENPLIQDLVPAMSTTPVVSVDRLLYFNGHTLIALRLE
jgi:outer membrane protein assembly factor BamB